LSEKIGPLRCLVMTRKAVTVPQTTRRRGRETAADGRDQKSGQPLAASKAALAQGAATRLAGGRSEGFFPRAADQPIDRSLLELLRCEGPLEIGELIAALGVTATAVRQRLKRAIDSGLVARDQVADNQPRRGRPRFSYRLTDAGHETAGDNFRDLAAVLWDEIRSIREPAIRRGLLGRIGRALADRWSDRVSGETPRQRLQSVADLLKQRAISCRVEPESAAALPVLVTHSCPYPELAEHDRGVCAAERMMLENLVGVPVRLADCRLDSGDCCRFVADSGPQGESSAAEMPRTAMLQQGGEPHSGTDRIPPSTRHAPRSRR